MVGTSVHFTNDAGVDYHYMLSVEKLARGSRVSISNMRLPSKHWGDVDVETDDPVKAIEAALEEMKAWEHHKGLRYGCDWDNRSLQKDDDGNAEAP